MGDVHSEAGRLLGFLGLPNDTTMMNQLFGMIEERIGPFIQGLCEEIILENMEEEVELLMKNEQEYYNLWKMWKSGGCNGVFPSNCMPQIDASYDMAWQQKGSGNVYNSQSGHGTLFGQHTRKVIGNVIKSKLCSYCNTYKQQHPDEMEVPLHDCWKNHEASSASMESIGAVELLVEAFEK